MDYTQLSDTELQEAINFHRRQRNMSRSINEAAHMRQTQIVRLLEAEEARRLDEISAEKKMEYGKAAFADYHKQSKAKLGKILSGDKDTSGESRKIANRLKGISTSSKTEEVDLDENLGKASKKMKFMFNTDPRDVKQRIKDASPEFRDKIRNTPGKLGGPAELQRRLAIKMKEDLDEGVSNLSDARLKFHVLKDIPHGSYTKKELSAEHDRRKKTGGAEYNAIKPSLNEEIELDEAKTDVYHQHMLKALGKTRLPKDHGYTSSIANNGDFVVRKGGEVAGRIPKGEHNLKEASMTPTDMKQREDIVKGMKKSAQDFKDRYGSKWKSVMYATATKAAMKEEVEELDEISRDLARSYIRKVADKNNTGEASPKEVMKRSPGVVLAGKKAYGIGGKARVNATEEVELDQTHQSEKRGE